MIGISLGLPDGGESICKGPGIRVQLELQDSKEVVGVVEQKDPGDGV